MPYFSVDILNFRTIDVVNYIHMPKTILRHKAEMLRKKGKSVRDIAELLNISRSTASVWCRDIVLTEEQIKRLENNKMRGSYKGRLRGGFTNKKKREDALLESKCVASKIVSKISQRDFLMLSIGLYWAEGHKTGRTFGLVNSDPDIIKVWMDSLLNMGVDKDSFSPRLFLNTLWLEREEDIVKWWSKKLSLPRKSFSKIVKVVSKHKKIFKENTYHGVLHVRVKKSSKLIDTWLSMIEVIRDSRVEK